MNMRKCILVPALLITLALMAHAGSSELRPDDLAYTHISPDGNRYTSLKADLPSSSPLDIELKGTPEWVLGMGEFWAVVLADGSTQAFRLDGRTVHSASLTASGVRADAPPVLIRIGEEYTIMSSGLTSPAFVNDGKSVEVLGRKLYIGGSETGVITLPDSRVLTDITDSGGRALVLTGPTSSYGHGVLGDTVEATGFTIIEDGMPSIHAKIPEGRIIEGTSAIWADLDGDGAKEVIVTTSHASDGARIDVYEETGGQKATGPPIGSGNRWRHQIAAAPFGPGGEMEIASIRTPHIGGTVEFFALDGKRLSLAASKRGYSSHAIGSRNLDMAVAGDLDSDGRVELLVPTNNMEALAGLRRTRAGVEEAWRLELPGRLSTNVAVAALGGRAVIGVGTSKGILRLWLP